jgi:MOSC domain-containing protein YiiM
MSAAVGGMTCRVVEGGAIALGDPMEALVSPPQRKIRLPGGGDRIAHQS